jgi:tetratricopeptide (TPR) repeat protein
MLKNSSNESETLQKRTGARALCLALSLTLLLPALSPSVSEAEAKSTEKNSKNPESLPTSITLPQGPFIYRKAEAESEKQSKSETKTHMEKKEKVEKAIKRADSKPKEKTKSEKKVKSEDNAKSQAVELSKEDLPHSVIGLPDSIARLINQGRWRAASQKLEARVKKEKDVIRDNAWLAFAYLFLGKSDELKKLADDAEKQAPKSPYSLLIKAFNQTLDGKFEEAEKLLLTLPPQFGGDPLANFALALVTAKQGKATAAAAYCQKSVELDPRFAWGYRTLGYLQQRWLEDIGRAEEAYAKALEIEPGMTEAQDALVDLRLSKNDFDGAIDVAKRAIKAAPKQASTHYRLAQIYTEQWRLRDALDVLQKAIDLDATNPRFFRSRATIKSFQGNLNGAIVDQQKAVDLSKDKAFELVELSNMNVLAGNNNRAAENLTEALKLEPDNQTAHDKLNRILAQEKRYDDMVAEGRRVMQRKPKDIRYRLEFAYALTLANRTEEAIEQYKEAAGLTNTDPEPWRRLGAIYIGKKDWSSAEKAYTNALNINPTSVTDLSALGFCYAEDDEFMKAEAAFVTALALLQLTPANQQTGPSKFDLMRSLAGLLFAEGRYADAAAQYESISLTTKNTAQGNFDAFMLAKAKAMRDLTKQSVRNLLAAYEKLAKEEKTRETVAVADALVKAGAYSEALVLLPEDLSSIYPKHMAEAMQTRAKALAQKGDLDQAISVASKATELKDIDYEQKSDAWFVLSELQLMKKDTQAAEASANKALESYVKSPEAYVMLGRIALIKEDGKTATNHAKRALELNPYYQAAYLLQGDAQMVAGAIKDARASFRRAVELYPGSMEAHRALLQALKKLALNDEAKHEEEQIAQLESLR